MLLDNLPALHIVVPLLAAPIAALCRSGRMAWKVAMAASFAVLFCAGCLLFVTTLGEPVSYPLGGWMPPIGIEYRIDPLNGFVLGVLALVSALMALYARESVAAEIEEAKQPLFYAAWLLCLTGLLGIVITNDAFNIYVFLEISSLSTYALIAMGKDRRALTAAFNYLILGTVGATFILIGVGFLYAMTGTLNITDLAMRLQTLQSNKAVVAAFAFILAGVSLKIALFPLHGWLPKAYTYAPSFATAFLSATATKVGIYVFLRFVFSVFGFRLAFEVHPLGEVLMLLSAVAITACSLVAIFQQNIKRMLAFSSLAQIGYITLGISLANETGLTGALVHIANHALTKGALFLGLGCVALRMGGVKLDDLAGLGKKMPWTALAIALAGASLVGMPFTAGFISKWYLITGALEEQYWPLVVLMLASSLMAAVYVWKIVDAMYFGEARPRAPSGEAPFFMQLSLWAMVGLVVFCGFNTALTGRFAALAAHYLMGL